MASFLKPLLITMAAVCGSLEFNAESDKGKTHLETLSKILKNHMNNLNAKNSKP